MSLAEIIAAYVQEGGSAEAKKTMIDNCIKELEEAQKTAESIGYHQLQSKFTCCIKGWIHDLNAMRTT